MAMYSWEIMPPPAGLEKNLGERRLTGHAGTGCSCSALLSTLPVRKCSTCENVITVAVLRVETYCLPVFVYESC